MNGFVSSGNRSITKIIARSVLLVILLISFNVDAADLVFVCAENNDLYKVIVQNGIKATRYDNVHQAMNEVPEGMGMLILADDYPVKTTVIDSEFYEMAKIKNLRLYIEYPSSIPGIKTGEVKKTRWERVVVTSDIFGESLRKMRIAMIHDCHFIPVQAAANPYLVIGKIAGFDSAVYGLDSTETYPILFEHPKGNILISTTKLSHFVTGRYAPKEAWKQIWQMILHWIEPDQHFPELEWVETVRPSFMPDDQLTKDDWLQATERGVEWYYIGQMLAHPSQFKDGNYISESDSGFSGSILGDGSGGIFECFGSEIKFDGSQPIYRNRRSDCASEASMAIAMRGFINQDHRDKTTAANLQDYVYFNSCLQQGSRALQGNPNYGFVGWYSTEPGCGVYYSDDNARVILGTLVASTALKSSRWDEAVIKQILANFRTTGPTGFKPRRIEEPDLQEKGWVYYWNDEYFHFAPHYQSWIWACYLWLYDKTHYQPLLERTKAGIRHMMKAYPHEWRWTNGLQQERARMLLPLAWLIRVDDTPEHRTWLKQIVDDLLSFQDVSGAIREEIGKVGHGSYAPPKSNADYGTNEAPLIQENGDPLADMLYTSNFAIFSLTEAAAATHDPRIKKALGKLADFMVRIQVRSEIHPELNGAWYRAFDFKRWEYWASNADLGWGAWATETGWTQAWIVTMLLMREQDQNLWDFTANSKIADHFDKYRKMMLPK